MAPIFVCFVFQKIKGKVRIKNVFKFFYSVIQHGFVLKPYSTEFKKIKKQKQKKRTFLKQSPRVIHDYMHLNGGYGFKVADKVTKSSLLWTIKADSGQVTI